MIRISLGCVVRALEEEGRRVSKSLPFLVLSSLGGGKREKEEVVFFCFFSLS